MNLLKFTIIVINYSGPWIASAILGGPVYHNLILLKTFSFNKYIY